jgi:hypothetical protein
MQVCECRGVDSFRLFVTASRKKRQLFYGAKNKTTWLTHFQTHSFIGFVGPRTATTVDGEDKLVPALQVFHRGQRPVFLKNRRRELAPTREVGAYALHYISSVGAKICLKNWPLAQKRFSQSETFFAKFDQWSTAALIGLFRFLTPGDRDALWGSYLIFIFFEIPSR